MISRTLTVIVTEDKEMGGLDLELCNIQAYSPAVRAEIAKALMRTLTPEERLSLALPTV